MNEGSTCFFLQAYRFAVGLVVNAALQHYLGTVALGSFYLCQRCPLGHNYGRLDTSGLRAQRHTLGMVACRSGNNAMNLLLFGQSLDAIGSAAHFKRAGALHILQLQQHLVASHLTKNMAAFQRCFMYYAS